MGATVQVDEELFDVRPVFAWQRTIGLVPSAQERHTAQRALNVALIGWLPLAVFAAATELIFRSGTAHSFLTDVAVHIRFLIALPLLILAEADAIPRFGHVASHFLSAGFIEEQDRERYADAVKSTRQLLDSKVADVAAVLLTYIIVAGLIYNLRRFEVPAWYWTSPDRPLGLSPAAWWQALVSLPLLLFLCMGWLWRVLLWWRFLAVMARFDLRLVPAHPDRACGLHFVSSSLRGYRLLAFAVGAIVAGTETNIALRIGQQPFESKHAAIAVVAFVLLLAAGPLLVFIPKLRTTKTQGIFKYGPLGATVGKEFEQKWLDRSRTFDEPPLDSDDFSAMTDLYQVVGNVYEIKDLPFGWRDLYNLVIMALLPFIPLAMMAVPLTQIFQGLMKLLL